MIGTADHPVLGAKAAESHGLLKFVHWLFERHLGRFNRLAEAKKRKAKLIQESVKAALLLDSIFQKESRSFTRDDSERAFSAYTRFLSFFLKAGGNHTPKCHFMVHMIQRTQFKGNPRLYSTYRDETFNGLIAKVARSCHRRTWANVVHWKCNALHQKNHQKVIKNFCKQSGG